MAVITKKILIETESREILFIRMTGGGHVRRSCNTCSEPSELLTLDESVSRFGLAALEILRRVQTGETHFLETPDGHLLICCDSLERTQNLRSIK